MLFRSLAENPRVHLFLMDYAQRQRVKIWGTARVVENDAAWLEKLMPAGYSAKGEQIVVFTVVAWDANCPQHIPQRFEAADVERAIAERDRRIVELEAQVAALTST